MGMFVQAPEPILTTAQILPFNAPRSIRASAQRIRLSERKDVEQLRRRAEVIWQRRAWEYFDLVGEIGFAFGLFGNVASRIFRGRTDSCRQSSLGRRSRQRRRAGRYGPGSCAGVYLRRHGRCCEQHAVARVRLEGCCIAGHRHLHLEFHERTGRALRTRRTTRDYGARRVRIADHPRS